MFKKCVKSVGILGASFSCKDTMFMGFDKENHHLTYWANWKGATVTVGLDHLTSPRVAICVAGSHSLTSFVNCLNLVHSWNERNMDLLVLCI